MSDVEQEPVNDDLGEFVDDHYEQLGDDIELVDEVEEEPDTVKFEQPESEEDDDETNEAESETEASEEETDDSEAESQTTESAEAAPEVEQDEPEEEPGLTLQQMEMLEIDEKLIALNPEVREAQELFDSLTKDRKAAKDNLDELLEKQAELCNELALVSRGGYQHKLPFKDDRHPDVALGEHRPHGTPALETVAQEVKKKQKPVDPAKKTAIHDLGLTESMTDKLMDGGIQFIAELEERIRKASMGNYKWHDGVTGIAKGGATKVEDALEAWRRENPVPCEDDDEEELEPVAVDTDGDLKPVNDLEEPAEEPEDEIETVWWCCSCDHTWPIDGDNHICPECETNEGGNCHIGFNGCPDADEDGIVKTGYEDVQIVEGEGMSCTVRVYCNQANLWNSSIIIGDGDYHYDNNLLASETIYSTSRDAAILNELGALLDQNEDISETMRDEINDFIDLHLNNVPGNSYECGDCQTVFFSDAEDPQCFYCGSTTLVKND